MFHKSNTLEQEQPRLPEFRCTRDPIADAGRTLRDRLDALRPKDDLKHWR